MIRDLEEGASAFHDRKGSLQKRTGGDRVKDEAVRLGETYGLCSRWTSFVAVEKRETPVKDEMQLRRIPVALTRGWGGVEETLRGGFGGAMPTMARNRVLRAAAPASSMVSGFVDRLFSRDDSLQGLDLSFERQTFEAELELASTAEETSPVLSTERPLDRLVALQRADGSWDLTEDLAEIVGKSVDDLETRLAEAEGETDLVKRAWATALALIWLKVEANQFVDEWVLLEKKARKWLGDCPARLAGGQEWLDTAAEIFS